MRDLNFKLCDRCKSGINFNYRGIASLSRSSHIFFPRFCRFRQCSPIRVRDYDEFFAITAKFISRNDITENKLITMKCVPSCPSHSLSIPDRLAASLRLLSINETILFLTLRWSRDHVRWHHLWNFLLKSCGPRYAPSINNSYRKITTQGGLRDAFLISFRRDTIYTCSRICIAKKKRLRNILWKAMNLRATARKVTLFIWENNLLHIS